MQEIYNNWICFDSYSGYSQGAFDIIRSVDNINNLKLSIQTIGKSKTSENQKLILEKKKDNNIDYIDTFYCIPPFQKNFKNNKNIKKIGFGIFETFDFPQDWISVLESNDIVLCPSLFNYEELKLKLKNKNICYLPACFDSNLFNIHVESTIKNAFNFLFFGTWRKRKGNLILLEAFLKEFNGNNNIFLTIKSDRYSVIEKDIDIMIKQLKLPEKCKENIIVDKSHLPYNELPLYLKSFHCLISPTIGEGFGLPGLQCTALGVPIIITNCTGCKDYAKEEFSTLIEPEGYVMYSDVDQVPQYRNKKWAYFTVAQVRNKMTEVIKDYDNKLNNAYKGALYVKNNFSYEIISKKYIDILFNQGKV